MNEDKLRKEYEELKITYDLAMQEMKRLNEKIKIKNEQIKELQLKIQ